MDMLWAIVGGVLAGVATYVIGGLGVLRLFRHRLDSVADDVEFLSARWDRERKRQAGLKSVRARENIDLADELASKVQFNAPVQVLEGRTKRVA